MELLRERMLEHIIDSSILLQCVILTLHPDTSPMRGQPSLIALMDEEREADKARLLQRAPQNGSSSGSGSGSSGSGSGSGSGSSSYSSNGSSSYSKSGAGEEAAADATAAIDAAAAIDATTDDTMAAQEWSAEVAHDEGSHRMAHEVGRSRLSLTHTHC